MSYLILPSSGGGVPIYASPVSLPASAATGTVASVISDGTLRQWTGTVWATVGSSGGGGLTGVANTNSINLTNTSGTVTGIVNLSAAAAAAGNVLVNLSIQSDGVRAQIPTASGSITGAITSTDWTTFNNKLSGSQTLSTTAPLTGGGTLSSGLTLAMPVATSSANGYLASSDWTTFNSKLSGTTSLATTAPLSGGGSLSSGLTLTISQATTSTNGYLSSTDWNTFNGKLSGSTSLATTAPLTGGGTLSSGLTLAIPVATTSVNGYLSSTDWTTFNAKVATTRAINTTAPLTGGGDLSADRTLAITQATTSTNGYLSSTDWNTFNNKSPAAPAYNVAQSVYVSNGGNDTTGLGTIIQPWATISYAMSQITDASSSKRYAIVLDAGFYSENNPISLKPYVYIVGKDRTANRINLNGNNFVLGSGWNSGSSRMGMFNIYLTGTTGVIMDMATAGGTGSNVFEFDNFGVNGPFTFLGRAGSADFTQVSNSMFFGAVTLTTSSHSYQSCQFNSTVTVDTANGNDNVEFTGFANLFNAAVAFNSSSGKTNQSLLSANNNASTLSLSGSGTTLTSDVVSLPAPSSITNTGGTIAYVSYPANLNGFTAAVQASLSGTAPVSYNTSTGVISMAAATTSANGYLTSTDWSTFNGKLSGSTSISTTAPLTGGGTLSSGLTLAIPAATTSVNGYLTSTDWTTFNGKQQAITVGSLGSGNANGLALSGGTLTLHAATATQPGALAIAAQTIAGAKTFSSGILRSNDTTNASFVDGISGASAFASSTSNTTATCTFASGLYSYAAVVQTAAGASFTVYADYASTAISCPSDPSNIFLPTNSGTGIYVSKSANSATLSFKNLTGSTQLIGIQALIGNFASTTAWA